MINCLFSDTLVFAASYGKVKGTTYLSTSLSYNLFFNIAQAHRKCFYYGFFIFNNNLP